MTERRSSGAMWSLSAKGLYPFTAAYLAGGEASPSRAARTAHSIAFIVLGMYALMPGRLVRQENGSLTLTRMRSLHRRVL